MNLNPVRFKSFGILVKSSFSIHFHYPFKSQNLLNALYFKAQILSQYYSLSNSEATTLDTHIIEVSPTCGTHFQANMHRTVLHVKLLIHPNANLWFS